MDLTESILIFSSTGLEHTDSRNNILCSVHTKTFQSNTFRGIKSLREHPTRIIQNFINEVYTKKINN
jgi:hypothetical protein